MIQGESDMLLCQLLPLLLLLLTTGEGAKSSSACKDKSPGCKEIGQSYCNDDTFRKLCKATCGLCTVELSIIADESCKDKYFWCQILKQLCGSIPNIAKRCKKTCGLCQKHKVMTTPSPTTIAAVDGAATDAPCECGIANEPSRNKRGSHRIVGGREAGRNKYPWVVQTKMRRHIGFVMCGGSIINTRYILTAAHCTYIQHCQYPYSPDAITVTVAEHNFMSLNDDIKGVTEKLTVVKIIRHEEYCIDPYSPTSFNNDIALLLLPKDLELTHQALGIVCLPEKASSTYGGKTVWAAGWGDTSATTDLGQAFSHKLQEVNLMMEHDCNEFPQKYMITNNMICAGDAKQVKDSCGGDSGGPLMYKDQNNRYIQIGIVSFGPTGGNCTGFGVYTAVARYLDWIKEKTRDGKCQ